ncbi:MAG: DNA polymerase III subunit delta [Nitrospirales bacterium]
MKPHELKGAIQRDGLASLYMIVGEEAYIRDSAVETIRTVAQKTSNSSEDTSASEQFFNYDVLYGDETDAREVLTIVQEMSFFVARRLVILTWAEKLPAREGESLIPYLQNPTDTTTLVMVASKLDGRMKWVQQLKKQAVFVDCAPLYDNQRIGWVKQQAAQAGIQLENDALQMLGDSAAEGLYVTNTEIAKLSAYLAPGACGTLQDIEAIQGMEPGASVFDLSEAIGAGASGKALRIVAKNLEVGEAPLRILGALIWQVRRIWKAKDLLQQGIAQSQVAKQVGIPPFRASGFIRQAQQWTQPQLKLAWEGFCRADSALKGSGSSSPKRVLDGLVILLSQEGKRSGQARVSRATRPGNVQKPMRISRSAQVGKG